MPQNLARRRAALSSSRRGHSRGSTNRAATHHHKHNSETQRPPAGPIHTAAPPPDSAAPLATPDTSLPPNSRKMKPQSPAPPSTSGSTICRWPAAPDASSKHWSQSSAHGQSAIPSRRPAPPLATPPRPLPRKTSGAHRDPLPPAPSKFQSRDAPPTSPSPAYLRCPATPPSAPGFRKLAATSQTP